MMSSAGVRWKRAALAFIALRLISVSTRVDSFRWFRWHFCQCQTGRVCSCLCVCVIIKRKKVAKVDSVDSLGSQHDEHRRHSSSSTSGRLFILFRCAYKYFMRSSFCPETVFVSDAVAAVAAVASWLDPEAELRGPRRSCCSSGRLWLHLVARPDQWICFPPDKRPALGA